MANEVGSWIGLVSILLFSGLGFGKARSIGGVDHSWSGGVALDDRASGAGESAS